MFKRVINKIVRIIFSLEKQAKFAGVKMGEGNLIYSWFWGTEPYLITIGNHCQITGGVKILTHGGGHVLRKDIEDFDTFGKVCIGNWCYIGFNTLIMPGVTIGDNVLIAAGSVVTKSVPSNVVIGGNPAHIISTIEEYKMHNELYDLNSKRLNPEEKKKLLLSIDNSKFVKKQYMKK